MATITGIGTALGSRKIPIEEIARKYGKSGRRIGINHLYRLGEETILDISEIAVNRALEDAGISRENVSGIYGCGFFCSQWLMPEYTFQLGNKLGLRDIPLTPVGQGCAGGVEALRVACDRISSQFAKGDHYLVVAANQATGMLDDTWENDALFSDGVSALVVSSQKGKLKVSEMNGAFCGESEKGDLFSMRVPFPEKGSDLAYRMNGPAVGEFVVKRAIPRVLKLLGLEKMPDDCYFIPHFPNGALLRVARDNNSHLGLNEDNFYIGDLSNTSPASVFFGLEDVLTRNLHRGRDIILGAFGAGLNVSAARLSVQD